MKKQRKIWVSSDEHIGHANMWKFENCSRPTKFKDVEEMNRTIVNNHNAVVADEDIWYCLGDVYFGNKAKAHEILRSLKGRKRLILGNHDVGKNKVLYDNFQKIYSSRHFAEYNAVLTHIPIHPDCLHRFGRNIHGHLHDNVIDDPRYISVCMEKTNYFPVDVATL